MTEINSRPKGLFEKAAERLEKEAERKAYSTEAYSHAGMYATTQEARESLRKQIEEIAQEANNLRESARRLRES
jgi:hypothetical protein